MAMNIKDALENAGIETKQGVELLVEGKKAVELSKALIKRGVATPLTIKIVNSLNEKKLLNNYFHIEVVSDPRHFNPANGKSWMQHNWAGGRESETSIDVLVGDIVPGSFESGEYYDNGNLTDSVDTRESAEFTIAEPQAVVKWEEVSDHFNGNNEDELYASLVVYQPNFDILKQEKRKILEGLKLLGF